MKIFTVYPKDLTGLVWEVAEIRRYTKVGPCLHTIGIRGTFAEACSLERTCRKNEFSEVLKKPTKKRAKK